jgi:UDP-N-acetyl-D-glucosamine dehydrogenase
VTAREPVPMSPSSLEQRISDRTAVVGVVGLGYVGVPLATRAAEAGYRVKGIDKYLDGKGLEDVRAAGIDVSNDFSPVGECDVVLICVPTPLAEGQLPDMSFIREAAGDIASNIEKGKPTLVVLESTSYPGTTREVVLPILEEKGLRPGEDFHLAFAPERVDPGTSPLAYEKIPRVVGGLDEAAGRAAEAFYEALVGSVHRVSTPEVAEMSKLLENIFRAVNIALVNEMALLCRRMDIDIWEVVQAAGTKPFGFMSFKPGPGMGGHCIPVDPFYLAWRARQYDFYPEFIELAGKINRSMPYHIAEWVVDALNELGMSLSSARVLVIGVAYKENISDTRESPALKIIEILAGRGADVIYHDPFVESVTVGGQEYRSVDFDGKALEESDCILIVTAQPGIDYEAIKASGKPVVDTRNILPPE